MARKIKNVKQPYLKGRVRRIIAYFVDWCLGTMFVFLPYTIVLNANKLDGSFHISILEKLTSGEVYIAGGIGIFFAFIYYFLVPAFFMKGQTLGKKICSMKIVDVDGSDLALSKLFIRQCIFTLFVYIHAFPGAIIFKELLVYVGYTGKVVDYILYTILFLSIGMFMVFKTQQSLHDCIVKSKVVCTK